MVFGFDDAKDNYDRVQGDDYDEPHKSKFSHELIAGAAAFAGFRAFENEQRKEGKPVEHAFAKEALAGFVAAEADKFAETKGLDFVDREKAKHEAKKRSNELYENHYGDQEQYDPSSQDAHAYFQQ